MGSQSLTISNKQFDDIVQQFSTVGPIDGSHSLSIAPSMAFSRPYPQLYQYMFTDAPDDNTSARRYDLTRRLRTNFSKRLLNERVEKMTSRNTPSLTISIRKTNRYSLHSHNSLDYSKGARDSESRLSYHHV